MKELILVFLLGSIVLANAALDVKLSAPERIGNKAVIKLLLKNTFTEEITSARAVIFLLDDNGKVTGQATRWVIGGTKENPKLGPKQSATYTFVILTEKPFTKTKVSLSRLILEAGKVVDPAKNVF